MWLMSIDILSHSSSKFYIYKYTSHDSSKFYNSEKKKKKKKERKKKKKKKKEREKKKKVITNWAHSQVNDHRPRKGKLRFK